MTLVGATSPLTDDVTVHETTTGDDGTMSMGEPDGGVTIEAGASFVLEPGGAHVMLDGVDAADVVAPVEVTFVFDDGSETGLDVTADAEVRPLDDEADLPGVRRWRLSPDSLSHPFGTIEPSPTIPCSRRSRPPCGSGSRRRSPSRRRRRSRGGRASSAASTR